MQRVLGGVLGGILSCMGCGPGTGVVLLEFQTEASFVLSDVGRLRVVRPAPEDTCSGLLVALGAGTALPAAPVWDSGEVPVCDFRSGGVLIRDVPEGSLAYLFSAGRGAHIMAYGCRIADARDGPTSVTLTVAASDHFLSEYGAAGASELPCRSIAAKCDLGCSP